MKQQSDADARLAGDFTAIAIKAARAIRAIDFRSVSKHLKEDRSPVTAADEVAQAAILDGLAGVIPGMPIVSEEAVGQWRTREPGADYLLVDPLDGTREFLAGRDEYTVNIALVRNGIPVVGVVAAPALGLLWRGAAGAAERLGFSSDGPPDDPVSIRARPMPAGERVAAVSRSHYDAATAAFLERFAPVTSVACGSALKFCRVAEGAIDIYPRLAPTSEWDVAAGHALVMAAGGAVTAPDGGVLGYGRAAQGFIVPGFVAWGDAAAARRQTA